jgi:hypothetical protein
VAGVVGGDQDTVASFVEGNGTSFSIVNDTDKVLGKVAPARTCWVGAI